MQTYLGFTWNTGSVVGEMVTNIFLIFFILTATLTIQTKYKKQRSFLIPIAWAISFITSLMIGKGISELLEPGSSLKLATPFFAIIQSIRTSHFALLPAIIGMQTVGFVIGVIGFVGFRFALDEQKTSFKFLEKEKTIKQRTITSIIFQPLFLFGATLIMVWASNTQTGNGDVLDYISVFVLMLFIFIVLLTSSPLDFFSLNPFISLIISTITVIKTKNTLAVINNGIELVVAVTATIGIGFILKAVY